MSPRCTCQRRATWAGVRPSRAAMAWIVASSLTLPCAIGDQASTAIAVTGARGAHLLVAEERVRLDLVHGRHDAGLLDDPVEVGGLEVGDADGGGAAVLLELDEGLPGRHEVAVVPRRERPVDEEQVDPVQPEPGERLVEGAPGVVGPVEAVVELGGHVELVAGDPRGGDRLADPLLVLVHLRGVEVAVARLEGAGHRRGRLVRRDLEHAEAELGDGRLVVEGDRGNGHTDPNRCPVRLFRGRRTTGRGLVRRARPGERKSPRRGNTSPLACVQPHEQS